MLKIDMQSSCPKPVSSDFPGETSLWLIQTTLRGEELGFFVADFSLEVGVLFCSVVLEIETLYSLDKHTSPNLCPPP